MENDFVEFLAKKIVAGFFGKSGMSNEMFDGLIEKTPKVSGHIIADAKVIGKKAEAEHLAGGIQFLMNKIDQMEAEEEKLQEIINDLEQDVFASQKKVGELSNRLVESTQESVILEKKLRELQGATAELPNLKNMVAHLTGTINTAINILTLHDDIKSPSNTVATLRGLFKNFTCAEKSAESPEVAHATHSCNGICGRQCGDESKEAKVNAELSGASQPD